MTQIRYRAKTGRDGKRLHFIDCGPMEMRLTEAQARKLFEDMGTEWGAQDGEGAMNDGSASG